MNPYETTSVDPIQNDRRNIGNNAQEGIRTCVGCFLLALMGGTVSLFGLMLGACSMWLIAANVSVQGRLGIWAIVAFPVAFIALIFSCILLTFGALGVRDAYRQYELASRIFKQHREVEKPGES